MPILDRLPEFDERSRLHNVRSLLPSPDPRSYTWRCTANLDQGNEGACVGFGWAHEGIARPKVIAGVNNATAFNIYHDAQKIDEWPGEDYQGTSVLAGAKVCQRYGWYTEYRWAFTTMDALAAISRHGPAVIGINWYEGMWDTDERGFIRPTGRLVGGHAPCVRGVNVKDQTVLIHNSWGASWGGTKWGPGTALLTWDDFDRLLHEDGECCIPVRAA
jgi:hypothetical protein